MYSVMFVLEFLLVFVFGCLWDFLVVFVVCVFCMANLFGFVRVLGGCGLGGVRVLGGGWEDAGGVLEGCWEGGGGVLGWWCGWCVRLPRNRRMNVASSPGSKNGEGWKRAAGQTAKKASQMPGSPTRMMKSPYMNDKDMSVMTSRSARITSRVRR